MSTSSTLINTKGKLPALPQARLSGHFCGCKLQASRVSLYTNTNERMDAEEVIDNWSDIESDISEEISSSECSSSSDEEDSAEDAWKEIAGKQNKIKHVKKGNTWQRKLINISLATTLDLNDCKYTNTCTLQVQCPVHQLHCHFMLPLA